MPAQQGRDSEGCYWQWGHHGKKYHYECGNHVSSQAAKDKADKQGAAIHATQNSKGKF